MVVFEEVKPLHFCPPSHSHRLPTSLRGLPSAIPLSTGLNGTLSTPSPSYGRNARFQERGRVRRLGNLALLTASTITNVFGPWRRLSRGSWVSATKRAPVGVVNGDLFTFHPFKCNRHGIIFASWHTIAHVKYARRIKRGLFLFPSYSPSPLGITFRSTVPSFLAGGSDVDGGATPID